MIWTTALFIELSLSVTWLSVTQTHTQTLSLIFTELLTNTQADKTRLHVETSSQR